MKFKEIEELFISEGIHDFSQLPNDKEVKRKFVKLYNEFNKYLSAAMIQGYIPKKDDIAITDSNNQEICEQKNNSDLSTTKEDNTESEILNDFNSPITQNNLDALNQRYKDISKESHTGPQEIPYDIEGWLTEIDDGKIDSDYMNNRFTKYLKVLTQEKCTKEELEEALNNLHKSFASLSKEKQKYANLLLNDINSGDIAIESGKSFMDYITEYESKAANDQIKKISDYFGLDESKLRYLMTLPLNETNLNEYNRFDELLNTVDKEKAKESLEKLYNKELKKYQVNIEINKILRNFILLNGFDLELYFNEKMDQ